MRALSLRQASDCEQGRRRSNYCRCCGTLHGARRGDGLEFFNALPKADAHAIPRRWTGRIPDGSEPGAVPIPLFDRRDVAPVTSSEHVVYLAAPIALYGTDRYRDAVCQVKARHPGARIMLCHEQYRDNVHWRASYRRALQDVTHLYTLTRDDGTIGAGAYAELVHVARKDSPLVFSGALLPHPHNSLISALTTAGRLQPLSRLQWSLARAAAFRRPRKDKGRHPGR